MHFHERLSNPGARGAFDIPSVSVGGHPAKVTERIIRQRLFAKLIAFSRTNLDQRRMLVIPPLAGGFPVLHP